MEKVSENVSGTFKRVKISNSYLVVFCPEYPITHPYFAYTLGKIDPKHTELSKIDDVSYWDFNEIELEDSDSFEKFLREMRINVRAAENRDAGGKEWEDVLLGENQELAKTWLKETEAEILDTCFAKDVNVLKRGIVFKRFSKEFARDAAETEIANVLYKEFGKNLEEKLFPIGEFCERLVKALKESKLSFVSDEKIDEDWFEIVVSMSDSEYALTVKGGNFDTEPMATYIAFDVL